MIRSRAAAAAAGEVRGWGGGGDEDRAAGAAGRQRKAVSDLAVAVAAGHLERKGLLDGRHKAPARRRVREQRVQHLHTPAPQRSQRSGGAAREQKRGMRRPRGAAGRATWKESTRRGRSEMDASFAVQSTLVPIGAGATCVTATRSETEEVPAGRLPRHAHTCHTHDVTRTHMSHT